jgi:hypothetical protein
MTKLTGKRCSLDCQGLLAYSLNWLSDCSTADSFSAYSDIMYSWPLCSAVLRTDKTYV